VLSRQNIEDVIKFARREKLFILADEVCCILAVLLTLWPLTVLLQFPDPAALLQFLNVFERTE